MKRMCKCFDVNYKKCCCNCWNVLSDKVKTLVQSKALEVIIIILILLNSIVLATEHYD